MAGKAKGHPIRKPFGEDNRGAELVGTGFAVGFWNGWVGLPAREKFEDSGVHVVGLTDNILRVSMPDDNHVIVVARHGLSPGWWLLNRR